ncbi:MAG: hypothetical protein ACTSRG_01525 [Candidatus Helarchaeota archaeon]
MIEIKYKIKNESKNVLETFHYVELPVYIDSDISKNTILAYDNKIEVKNISNWKGSQLKIKNSKKKFFLKLSTQQFSNFLLYPLLTYVTTDGGYDTLFQGAIIGLQNKVKIRPDEVYKNSFIIDFVDEKNEN